MLRFHRILVPLDSRDPDAGHLEFVARLARAHGAEVTLCDVVRDLTWAQRFVLPDAGHVEQLLREERSRDLDALAAKFRQDFPVSTKVLHGSSSDAIVGLALDGKHDLIVTLAKGKQSRRQRFFGTTAYRLLQAAPCSILLYEPGKQGPFRRLVASVDATPDDSRHAELNDRIVESTLAVCQAESCPWEIVFAWSVYGEYLIKDYLRRKEFGELFASAEAQFSQAFEKLLQRYGCSLASPNVHLVHGEAAEQVSRIAAAAEADLIVLGTVARHGVSRIWLGNTAESVLDRANCSVLIVKPN